MTSTKLLRAHTGLLASLDVEIEHVSDPALFEASASAVSKWSVKDHVENLRSLMGEL
jgi:hypothetical protein